MLSDRRGASYYWVAIVQKLALKLSAYRAIRCHVWAAGVLFSAEYHTFVFDRMLHGCVVHS